MTTKRNLTIPIDPILRYFGKGLAHIEWGRRTADDLDINFRRLHERLYTIEQRVNAIAPQSAALAEGQQTILGGTGGGNTGRNKIEDSKYPFTEKAVLAEGSGVAVGYLIHVTKNGQVYLADSGSATVTARLAHGVCVKIDGTEVEYAPFSRGLVRMLDSDYDSSGNSELLLGHNGRFTNKVSDLYNLQWVGKMNGTPSEGFVNAITAISFGPFVRGPIAADVTP